MKTHLKGSAHQMEIPLELPLDRDLHSTATQSYSSTSISTEPSSFLQQFAMFSQQFSVVPPITVVKNRQLLCWSNTRIVRLTAP
jgi:hypothetical protein